MGTISSYSYGEISTFGGSRDSEFIMVVSPHQKGEDEQQHVNRGGGGTLNRNTGNGAGGASGTGGGGVVKTEKLVFTMPKLQVCTTALFKSVSIGLLAHVLYLLLVILIIIV